MHKRQYRLWLERVAYWMLIGGLLAAICALSLSRQPYAIMVDGKAVAWVNDAEAAKKVVELALKEAQQNHNGYKVTFQEQVTFHRYRPPKGQQVTDLATAKKRLLENVTVAYKASAIIVNDKSVLAMPDEQTADAVLDAVKAHYAQGLTDLVKEPTFKEKVVVKEKVVSPTRVIADVEKAKEKLIYGLEKPRFHTIRQGDFAVRVARRYGIPLEELQRLNPTKDLNRLNVGDVLRISSGKALLTVVTVRQKVERQPIDFKVISQPAPNLPGAVVVTKRRGQKGEKEAVIQIICENGVEVRRKVVSEKVIQPPVDELRLVGIGLR